MSDQLSAQLLSELGEFVAHRLGLEFPRRRWPDLERSMRSLARELQFDDVESCVHSFVSLPTTQAQIEALASSLTIGETYFFRERQSFQALEGEVLPRLIENRRGKDQRLRIWSAGCCTGEEPYSLAILLRRLIGELNDWQITILATDINPRFLKKAEEGVYGEWSFRGVAAALRERYFVRKAGGRFEVLPDIKRMVTFSYLNLAEDNYPSLLNGTNAMDIILCRNVLMYFTPKRAIQVVREFHNALLEGGWLIVSPSESSNALYSQFVAVNFPDAIFYKKDGHKPVARAPVGLPEQNEADQSAVAFSRMPPPEPQVSLANVNDDFVAHDAAERKTSESRQPLYTKSWDFYRQGLYDDAAHTLATLLAKDADNCKAMALLARVHANQGKLAEATQWCEKAIAADKLDPACYILHAMILQEQNAIANAMLALQRALYLDQSLVLAHFALGNLARQQGKTRAASKCFDNARRLLATYSAEQILPESDGMTAGRLMEIIGSILSTELIRGNHQRSKATTTATAGKQTLENEPQ